MNRIDTIELAAFTLIIEEQRNYPQILPKKKKINRMDQHLRQDTHAIIK